ncbi:MAG TPA: CsbD family protein [Advenella sp.]|nr:CsbD family protein [Advenella sp.]
MNPDDNDVQWEQVKDALKERWSDLSDDDIADVDGDAQRMCGVLQEKYGLTRAQAEQEVDNFWARHNLS